MTKYRVLYVLLLLSAIVFAVAYESRLTFILMAALAVLPVISFVFLLLTRFLLKFEVSPKELYVHKQQEFDITVKVTNRFIVPVSPIRITGFFHDTDGMVTGGKRLIISVMPFSSSEIIFSGNISYRGEYILGLETAEIYDLLRIFRFKIKFTPDCCTIVAPRRLSIDNNSVLSTDDYDSNITSASFVDDAVFSSVRKYADGDSLKHVHWKLTAKQDELIVKQMEQSLGSNAVLIVDTSAVSDSETENMRSVDAVIETALAITKRIISDGRCAVNIYRSASGRVDITEAETNEDYERLFSVFSVLPISENELGTVSLVSEMNTVLTGSEPLFIIAPSLSGDALRTVLDSGGELSSVIRIYLTSSEADDGLVSVASSRAGISIYEIDPEDIALSLRNSMEID